MRIYLLALVIGLIVGALASAFHYCLKTAFDLHAKVASLFSGDGMTVIIVAALLGAVMMGVAFVLVRRFAPEASGSGIQEIEGAMVGVRTIRWRRVIPVKFVSGVLAIGSGLVLGREGPTIHIGGCVARMVGEKAKASVDTMNTLLAAGAAAGLSAAFSAPIAGVLFVTEEMHSRFNYTFIALHATIIASITAKVVNDQVFGMGPALPIQLKILLPHLVQPKELLVLVLSYLVLGGLIGVCGAGFNAVLLGCLRISDRLGRHKMLIAAASLGAAAGALMIIAPDFVGGGESMIEAVFSSSPGLGFLVALLVVRTAMTFLSYSAGVPGGIFAPMLALGTLIGLGFGYSVQEVFPNADLHAGAFAVAAMGGLFAATVRAPLTGIVLVAELTSTFELLPAMVITCVTASITAQSLGSTPVYELLLARALEGGNSRKTA